MKLWQAILLTLIIIAFLYLLPKELINPIGTVMVLLSAAWIYKDAEKLNTQRYQSVLGISPFVIAVCTAFVWPIFFPGYLWLRYRIKNNLLPIREKYKNNNQNQNNQQL